MDHPVDIAHKDRSGNAAPRYDSIIADEKKMVKGVGGNFSKKQPCYFLLPR
jgi:hypothetical protein